MRARKLLVLSCSSLITFACASAPATPAVTAPDEAAWSECDQVKGIECGDPSELAGIRRFCIAIDGHPQKIKLTRELADTLNKAGLPGVTFTALGVRCPPDTEGYIFYNVQRSYGTVDRPMPNGNLRILINHISGGISLEKFLAEFLEEWSRFNVPSSRQ